MPIQLIASAEVPKAKRSSKFEKLKDWTELASILAKGIQNGKTVKLTFSPETIKAFGEEQKAAKAFLLKLRGSFANYRVSMIGGQIFISPKSKKESS